MKKKPTEKELQVDPNMVPALYRGLRLLEAIADRPEGAGATVLDALGIPSATRFRMLYTLTKMDYLTRDSNDVYHLSRKVLKLADKVFDETGLVEKSAPAMRKARDLAGETILLATLYGNEGVVLHEEESKLAVRVSIRIGHHFPLHSAAPAKAIMAFLPADECDRLIQSIHWTPFTAATITTPEDFRTELEQIRQDGIAYDQGEELEDLRCVAAPICNSFGYPVAAVWFSGPASRMNSVRCGALVKMIKQCANDIQQRI